MFQFFARACQNELERRRVSKIDEENWGKRICAHIALGVKEWWKNLNTLSQYQNILANNKRLQTQLSLRPSTPESSEELIDSQSELAQLAEDQKIPIHMMCDIEQLYPKQSKKGDLSKLSESAVREAEMVKQKVIELSEIKNIDHTLSGVKLSMYQLQGVRWMIDSRKHMIPCHLADERGLAKRTQILGMALFKLSYIILNI